MNRQKFLQTMGRAAAGLWAGQCLPGPLLAYGTGSIEKIDPLAAPLGAIDAGFGSGEFKPFYFIHNTDTHAGYGANGAGNMPYFNEVLKRANQQRVPFVAVTGDLINDGWLNLGQVSDQQATLDQALAKSLVPVKYTPGNHDVGNEDSFGVYRDHYGEDYFTFTYNNCQFIGLDSIILREPSSFPTAQERQMTWLHGTLAEARLAGRTPYFRHAAPPPFYAHRG